MRLLVSIILSADGVSVFLCFFAISVQFVSISLYLASLQATIIHLECELQFFLGYTPVMLYVLLWGKVTAILLPLSPHFQGQN